MTETVTAEQYRAERRKQKMNSASLRDGTGYRDIERAVAIRELAEEMQSA